MRWPVGTRGMAKTGGGTAHARNCATRWRCASSSSQSGTCTAPGNTSRRARAASGSRSPSASWRSVPVLVAGGANAVGTPPRWLVAPSWPSVATRGSRSSSACSWASRRSSRSWRLACASSRARAGPSRSGFPAHRRPGEGSGDQRLRASVIPSAIGSMTGVTRSSRVDELVDRPEPACPGPGSTGRRRRRPTGRCPRR